MTARTHELKIYASQRHATVRGGNLILHLWFTSEHSMQMDLDVALNRSDVSHVDVIDCAEHTIKRRYAIGGRS
jgi:hypothetical protein